MKQRLLIVTLVATGVLLLAIGLHSQGTEVTIWHTVDGGGDTSQGDTFTMRGTIGQPDAGAMAGDSYALSGGFWGGMGPATYRVYLPFVCNSSTQ